MRALDKTYIMQGRDTSCQLIALLNAFIYKFGVTPIAYKTKEFRMLAEIGFGVSGPLLSMKEIFTLLGVFKQEPTKPCDLQGWVDWRLAAGHPVSFPIESPTIGFHQALIVDAYRGPAGEQYYVLANAWFHFKYGSMESVQWRELASHQGFMSSNAPYSIHWQDAERMKRTLKKPTMIGRAVREYYHALKVMGYFPKPYKQKGKPKKNDQSTAISANLYPQERLRRI